jgi:hypothetical protein
MRLIIYSIIAFVSFKLGGYHAEYSRNRAELKLVDGYHAVCKDVMEGKKGGLPCSRCRAIVKEKNQEDPFFEHKNLIAYMVRKLGKDVEQFTHREMYELNQILFDLDK